DGSTFDAELLRSATRDPAGNVTGYVGVLIDIDDRKHMERDLRAANAELERLIGALRMAQARLVQHAKMAALGQLVAGVAHQLNQVFMNLIVNACQAMGDTGTLTISTRAPDAESVEVRIADTDCGIGADKLTRIFDPGFTTKGANLGTGLGLSIVYQIVEGHGGDISVDSDVGRGTCFTIVLPVRHVRGDGHQHRHG